MPFVEKSQPKSNLITTGSIAGTSFRELDSQVKRRLIVSVEGPEKQGKTHFALTAPGPIAYQGFDMGTEGVIDKPEFADKTIHLAEYRLGFPFSQSQAEQQWQQFINDYKAMLPAVRTGIVDTASEAWETLRIAKLGKLTQVMPHHYTQANSEYRELMRQAYDSDMNLILLHKVKKQYLNDHWTGKYERSGFNDTGFLVQVVTEAFKKDGKYFLRILSCRQRPQAEGTLLEDPTFAKLGLAVFPDSKEEEWT